MQNNIHDTTERFLDAASLSKWDEVQNTYIPLLLSSSPDEVASLLIKEIRDENSDVRVAVLHVLGLIAASISSKILKQEIIETIIERATEDPDALPTTYAGCALTTCDPDPEQQNAVNGSLAACRERIYKEGWIKEIQDTIPIPCENLHKLLER